MGVKIYTNLSWQSMLTIFLLNWTEPMLSFWKWENMLQNIKIHLFCYSDYYWSYCCLVWAQNCSTIQQIVILQKKAIRIINFQPRNSHTSHLFKQSPILKFQDKICLENILFVSKSLNNLSLPVFNTWFNFSSEQHNYEPSSSTQGNFTKLVYKTNRYVKYWIIVSAVKPWNKIQKQLKNMLLKDLSPIKLKQLVIFILNHINDSC